MSKSSRIRLQDHVALAQIINECRELGDDFTIWQQRFLEGLTSLVSADVAVTGELRDIETGTPKPVDPLAIPTTKGFEDGFNIAGWLRAFELLQKDPNYSSSLKAYGENYKKEPGIALRRSDLISKTEWYSSVEFNEVYRVIGVDNLICCFQPLISHPGEVFGLYVARANGRRDFSEREKQLTQLGIALVAQLLGGPLSRSTDANSTNLTVRCRQVLKCMLDGLSDKQIAQLLDISLHTVNQYAKIIFKHFQVKSRPELLSRWIRRGWGQKAVWSVDGTPPTS